MKSSFPSPQAETSRSALALTLTPFSALFHCPQSNKTHAALRVEFPFHTVLHRAPPLLHQLRGGLHVGQESRLTAVANQYNCAVLPHLRIQPQRTTEYNNAKHICNQQTSFLRSGSFIIPLLLLLTCQTIITFVDRNTR